MNQNKYRVAIVGSGPAGFYAADHLFKKLPDSVDVDMFDRLPTPHGLVRSGVAPDHQKIKTVSKIYDKIASNPSFRFFGLIEYGKHISLNDLKNFYHQIVFATGTQTDRKMNIPGEDLKGSYTATEFVAWYNGHPHFTDREFDLSVERVAIVGVGNVAIDVARILSRSENELKKTDIADYALEKLKNSNIKEIYLLGRRGPAQAAFTNPEIKELTNLKQTNVKTLKEEVELDEITSKYLEETKNAQILKKVEILKDFSSDKDNNKPKTLMIRFLVSPVEIMGNSNNKLRSIKLVKNELYISDDGSIRSRSTDKFEELEVDIVFRSIGYYGIPLPDVPFDNSWGIVPNVKGRVIEINSNKHVLGLYVTGWIKRGATGVIGTNKTDSGETVNSMIEDLENGYHLKPKFTDGEKVVEFIKKRNPDFISYEDWLKIDELEVEEGKRKGRPRIKFTSVDEMLKALKR